MGAPNHWGQLHLNSWAYRKLSLFDTKDLISPFNWILTESWPKWWYTVELAVSSEGVNSKSVVYLLPSTHYIWLPNTNVLCPQSVVYSLLQVGVEMFSFDSWMPTTSKEYYIQHTSSSPVVMSHVAQKKESWGHPTAIPHSSVVSAYTRCTLAVIYIQFTSTHESWTTKT